MTRILLPTLWLAACSLGGPAPSPPRPVEDVSADLAQNAVRAEAVQDTSPAADTGTAEVVVVDAAPTVAPWEPSEQATTWTVRRGETLAHFARWAELPVETVAEASAVPLDDALQVGAEVRIPGDDTMRGRVESARDAHHRRRAQGYLASRGGAEGTETYTVRTGDTAWSIARDEAGVPLWLVESYNPSVDLDALRPGQRLMLPVIADTTADAATPDSSEAP